MKYRIPNEFIDLIDVASTQVVDVSKHGVEDYDADAVIAYVRKNFESDEVSFDKDYRQPVSYSDNTETYRVCGVKFGGAGSITMFGKHQKISDGYRVIDVNTYNEKVKPPVEKTEEKKDDDKPIDLSEIPF